MMQFLWLARVQDHFLGWMEQLALNNLVQGQCKKTTLQRIPKVWPIKKYSIIAQFGQLEFGLKEPKFEFYWC